MTTQNNSRYSNRLDCYPDCTEEQIQNARNENNIQTNHDMGTCSDWQLTDPSNCSVINESIMFRSQLCSGFSNNRF